jgi:hemolysin activation/secretion protein
MRATALASFKIPKIAGSGIAFVWLALAAQTSPVFAQQSSPQPQRIDPQQPGRQIDANEAEQRRLEKPQPKIQRPAAPSPRVSGAPLFVLKSVTVKGAVAIPASEIAKVYRGKLGRTVSRKDLESIATAISDLYRAAGYHLSRAIIPPQDIQGGRLRIRVIEGAITDVRVKGNNVKKYGLASYFKALARERPSRLKTVERALLLANDVPGLRISDAAFEEIGSGTGRFRLIVSVETWSVFISSGIDNFGTYAAGPLQSFSSVYFNSALTAGDALGLSVSTVPDAVEDLRYGRASYDLPVGSDGARIGATGSFGEVRPDDIRRQFDTRTASQAFELRGSLVPIKSRDTSLTLAAAFALNDEKEEDTSGTTYQDRVRTVSLLADYKLHDMLSGWNYVTLGLKQGLDGLGATQSADPLSSRAGATPNFTVYSFAYTRQQPLFGPWSVRGQAHGQLASGPLFSSQSFSLGGPAFGPGYYSGDNGFVGLFELRFSQDIDQKLLKSYQLYGFIDGGTTWNEDYGQRSSLSSAGAGVRFELTNDWRGSVSFAVPVSYSSKSDEFRGSRVLFSVSKSFKLCPSRSGLRCSHAEP